MNKKEIISTSGKKYPKEIEANVYIFQNPVFNQEELFQDNGALENDLQETYQKKPINVSGAVEVVIDGKSDLAHELSKRVHKNLEEKLLERVTISKDQIDFQGNSAITYVVTPKNKDPGYEIRKEITGRVSGVVGNFNKEKTGSDDGNEHPILVYSEKHVFSNDSPLDGDCWKQENLRLSESKFLGCEIKAEKEKETIIINYPK